MKITDCYYGKGGCRVLKMNKTDKEHSVLDMNTKVLLHGKSFGVAYESDDNSPIVATDTVKNIIFTKAKDWVFTSAEQFAIQLVHFFINEYSHVDAVTVYIKETPWKRITVDKKKLNHSFEREGFQHKFCKAYGERNNLDSMRISSGFKGLEIMKTTQSGFVGYYQDKYTLLKPTKDRVLRSKVLAEWTYRKLPSNGRFEKIFDEVLTITKQIFADEYSPSVQNTLYLIGNECLRVIPELNDVRMEWPNIHCIPIASPVTTKNESSVLMVTSDPHGYIVGRVSRENNQSKL